MNTILFLLVVVLIVVVFVLRKKKSKTLYRRDYSLGLGIAKEVENLIKKGTYTEVESKVGSQSLNDISQIVDHLALSLTEEEILQWKESQKSDFSNLVLGTFYLHMAWIIRSHGLAANVTNNQAMGFFEHLDLSQETFNKISKDSKYNSEVESRKIRLYMSLGDNESASTTFFKLSKDQPEFLWPFIHYAELIQPKWGGSVDDIEKLYESLPDNLLVRSIVILKLVLDATTMDDNYFAKYNADINAFASEKLTQFDTEYDKQGIDSVHRFVFYNYMAAVADKTKSSKLQKKYVGLMKGNYTIYPYGLV